MNLKHINFAVELKAAEGGEEGMFAGHGSVFGNVDSYQDVVEKGAFSDSLNTNGMPALLWQHDAYQPIGIYTKCYEDERGLYVEGKLSLDVQKAREAYALLKAGALKGLSIGYSTEDYVYDEVNRVRRLKKVRLWEISLVTFPANAAATVSGVKDKSGRPTTIRQFEQHLRDAGFSKEEALRLAASAKSAMPELWDAAAESKVDFAFMEVMASLQKLQSLARDAANT